MSDEPHDDVRRGPGKLGRLKTREELDGREKTVKKNIALTCGIHMSGLVKEVRKKMGFIYNKIKGTEERGTCENTLRHQLELLGKCPFFYKHKLSYTCAHTLL